MFHLGLETQYNAVFEHRQDYLGFGVVASCWSFGGTMLHYTLATAFVDVTLTTCTNLYDGQLPFTMAFYYGR